MSSRADFALNGEAPQSFDATAALGYIWDTNTLAWVKATGGAAGGGLTNAELRATPVPVSGPLTDAQLRATAVPVSGTVTALLGRGATGTESNVAASATNVTLLASNANRIGAYCYNDSTVALYLKLGATASVTSFTVKLLGGAYYEIPVPVYTGIVDGLWDSASGSARMTEITA